MGLLLPEGVEIVGNDHLLQKDVLTTEALSFLAILHRTFDKRRHDLLKKRHERQHEIDHGKLPDLLKETAKIRSDSSWRVKPAPHDLQRRWIEITGPTDKKMIINALNSGADTFMADFEDANSPTWSNLIEGQANLIDTVRRKIHFESKEGKVYKLKDRAATLMVRPRGWHLNEKHLLIDGEPISGSLFDFGLYFFHNASELIKRNTGPYFYLPKLESHLEARLWNDVFILAQDHLNLPLGTIRATVLIETIMAAFEMEEILYELREHITALNAGRWDYIFSIIKKFANRLEALLPDRSQITMAVPFMKAYAKLLVLTCHKREAHAIGGMSAFIPSRKDPEVNKLAFTKVYEDKEREADQGFDGAWVAHPDLVQIAREPFFKKMENRSHQIYFPHHHSPFQKSDLLNFSISEGKITEKGMRTNIEITLRYLSAWLSGVGAVAIHNLMEDAATAEISRAQLWQWVHNPACFLDDKKEITMDLFEKFLKDEYGKLLNDTLWPESYKKHLPQAKNLLDRVIREDHFPEFLTLPAYIILE